MSEGQNTEEQVRRVECANCSGVRNCQVVGHHEERYSEGDFSACTDWYLLKCRGCDHTFVQTISTNSEDFEPSYDQHGEMTLEYVKQTNFWPALAKRKKPEWLGGLWQIPHSRGLTEALNELYTALDNDLNMLAGIGIRTSFDVASELLGVAPHLRFTSKLDNLVTKGHIGKVERDRLEVLVDAGGASAHRGWKPAPDDLHTLMDVLEHFLNEAFIRPLHKKSLDEKVTKIKASVPARQKGSDAKKKAKAE